MKEYVKSAIYEVKRSFRININKPKYFIKRVKRLLSWRKTIWESESWDFHFLLIVMDKKLQEMERLHRYEGTSENHEETANEINEVRKSISKIMALDEGNYKEKQMAIEEAKKIFSEDVAKKLFGWWD